MFIHKQKVFISLSKTWLILQKNHICIFTFIYIMYTELRTISFFANIGNLSVHIFKILFPNIYCFLFLYVLYSVNFAICYILFYTLFFSLALIELISLYILTIVSWSIFVMFIYYFYIIIWKSLLNSFLWGLKLWNIFNYYIFDININFIL